MPRVRQWIASLQTKPTEFIEPFAGGGIVGLTVAFEQLAERVTMVELDDQVAAVWKTILGEDNEWLANRVMSFDLSLEAVQAELARPPQSLREKAFQTLLKNRTYHGGILAPGSGILKYGENGKGIRSRWYPRTLKRRILDIARVAYRIRFIEADGMDILRQNTSRTDAVFFLDPPYTVAGKRAGTRLYIHNELDHEELFRIAQRLAGPFLMTYDNAEEVRRLAGEHGFIVCEIPMMNTHHAEMTELLIGRNLSWLDVVIPRSRPVDQAPRQLSLLADPSVD